MSVVTELIHLKLLDKKAFQECLRRYISRNVIEVKDCETLMVLLNTTCEFHEEFDIHSDDSLKNCYLELLECFLLPNLSRIITSVDSELPNHLEHFKVVDNVLKNSDETISSNSITVCLENHPSNRISNFCKSLDLKASEVSDMILAPKLIELILVVVKKLCCTNNFIRQSDNAGISDSLLPFDKIISFTGDIFDVIAKTLQDCFCGSLTKCDQQRVKFLSLVFMNFVKNNDWLYSSRPELKQCVKGVVEVALKLIQSSNDVDITTLLLNLIVHPFLETFSEERLFLVNGLWNIVLSYFTFTDEVIKVETNCTGFLILCFMADYIFKLDRLSDIRDDDRFYILIQFGMVHLDALTRKRSQYLLKRALDFCISAEDGNHNAVSSRFFHWDNENTLLLQNAWNDFFLILETLEEKQSHVIWPVLDKIDRLIEIAASKHIHVTWILAIFKRIFDHDNKGIRYWGVIKLLKLKLSDFLLSKGVIAFVNFHLITVLSDYSLYNHEIGQNNHVSGKVSSVGEEFGNFLTGMVGGLEPFYLNFFMHSLLENIFDGRTWGGIPLFYVMRGLSLIPTTHLWKYESIKDALVKFEGCLSTQEVSLRSASQCAFLKAVLKHLKPETSVIQLCSIIRHFRRKESWSCGTVTWQVLVESLDNFDEYKDAYGILSVEQALTSFQSLTLTSDFLVSPNDIALAFCLLTEKSLSLDNKENVNRIQSLLNPISSFLYDCHMRPYIDRQKFVWVLKFLCQIFSISNDVPKVSPVTKDVARVCLSQLHDSFSCIVQLFINTARSCDNFGDYEVFLLYLDLFAELNHSDAFCQVVRSHDAEIFVLCQELLDKGDVRFFYGIFILEHLWSFHVDESPTSLKNEIILLTCSKILLDMNGILGKCQAESSSQSKPSAKLQMEVTRSSWTCVELLITKLKTPSWLCGKMKHVIQDITPKTLNIVLDAISISGRANVLSVFRTCVQLLDIIMEENKWHAVVTLLWKSSCDFKKCCDLYHALIRCLCDVLFYPSAIIREDCHSTIGELSSELLDAAESTQGIASHMARSLVRGVSEVASKKSSPISSCETVIDILVNLSRFGAVFRKQQKIIKDTTAYIYRCSDMFSTSMLIDLIESDQQARAVVLRYFLSLSKTCPEDQDLAGGLFKALKVQYASCAGDRRDFANSQKHRYKTRLLQVFMILLPLLPEVECGDAMEWLCRGLIKEHQQPSVRYMQEWGIALIVIYHPSLFSKFFEHFTQGTKERVGCVGSFLASLTHIACTSEDASMLCHSIQYTLPWCMAQHFNTRLYAQVSLRKIWQHCEDKNVIEVLNQYRALQHCLQFVAEQGNAMRNTLNMLNDFYFKVFHPIKHYTIETILYDLPCLSLLSDDEWLSVDSLLDIIDVSLLPIKSHLPLRNDDKLLAESVPAPWVVKAAGETAPADNCEEIDSTRFNVQKKMTPWKSMIPEMACSMNLPNQKLSNQQRGALIVVASLIDKAPNLGGLCRTCEVFSVREYVVSSLAVQEDTNFNSLSLTAQQWVPMKEVKPDDLPAYLRTLQNEGYTLVAAEQTANSKLLSEYNFPERTVIVLGNEREGIPCDLLQLLDVCVEIPQTGIIRSLNVHVSGALFVWEYTRQHLNRIPKT